MDRRQRHRDSLLLSDKDHDILVDCLRPAIHCGYSHHVPTILDMAQDSSAVASAEYDTVNVRKLLINNNTASVVGISPSQ